MEVVWDLIGGNPPVTQCHSLVACLIHLILGEHPVSFGWWLLLPFTVQSSLPRRSWQDFLHSTLVETLKKRKKLETTIRTKWTIAWNPTFRWFPEREMFGFWWSLVFWSFISMYQESCACSLSVLESHRSSASLCLLFHWKDSIIGNIDWLIDV